MWNQSLEMQALAQKLHSSGHKSMSLFSVTFIFRYFNPMTANNAMSHQYTYSNL